MWLGSVNLCGFCVSTYTLCTKLTEINTCTDTYTYAYMSLLLQHTLKQQSWSLETRAISVSEAKLSLFYTHICHTSGSCGPEELCFYTPQIQDACGDEFDFCAGKRDDLTQHTTLLGIACTGTRGFVGGGQAVAE